MQKDREIYSAREGTTLLGNYADCCTRFAKRRGLLQKFSSLWTIDSYADVDQAERQRLRQATAPPRGDAYIRGLSFVYIKYDIAFYPNFGPSVIL